MTTVENNKKKLAICLFGISEIAYVHFSSKYFLVDWKLSYENYKKYIFEYFEKNNYDCDVFFCTNKNGLSKNSKEQLIKYYNPVNYMLTEEYDNHYNNYISRNDKVKKVIELCLSSNNKYDHVLITRFDLDFKKNFSECNFDFNSFNIISQTGEKTICDNFYFMPFNLLKSFHKVTADNLTRSFHYMKDNIIKTVGPINYILNENKFVQNLSFYNFVRTNLHKSPYNLPNNFNWKDYKKLNSDIKLDTEIEYVRHYIDYGKKENRKYYIQPENDIDFSVDWKQKVCNRHPRIKKKNICDLPLDFNWVKYVSLNTDLQKAQSTKETAIVHYLLHGIKEGRRYK